MLLRRSAALACLALVLASPTRVGAQLPPRMAATLGQVRERFSGQRAYETTRFVAQFWRVPGNTGFDASIHRVASILDSAGYVPEERAGPADRLRYRIERRRMDHPTWEPLGGNVRIVGDTAPLLRYETNRHLVTINSASTPPEGVEAQVVAVGDGQRMDTAMVAGKIVYALAPIGRVYARAVRLGAVGVMAYSLPEYVEADQNPNSIQFGGIPYDSTRAGWGVLLSTAAKRRLDAALANGPVRVNVTLRTRIYRADELTLVAEIRGSRVPDERFVFSAHVQEPGANDNASGVGAQAEMARVAAELVRSRKQDPARTITFLWGDEIRSTRRFLQDDSARARGVRWGVSLDMVGEDTGRTGGTFLIEKMPDPSAVWTRGEDRHTEWGGEAYPADRLRPHYLNDFLLQRCLDQAAGTGWVVRTNPFEGGSDHVPFLDAGKPTALFWHFTDHFYHTDADRIDKVSPTELANVGIASLYAALTLVSADDDIARQVITELEAAARTRLAAETRLSDAALREGGDTAREGAILAAWTRWYRGAIESVADLTIGGPSPALQAAIRRAAAGVPAPLLR